MSNRFGTPEWAAALKEEINGSSEYRNAANKWGVEFNGNLLFVFEADGSQGLLAERDLALLPRRRAWLDQHDVLGVLMNPQQEPERRSRVSGEMQAQALG